MTRHAWEEWISDTYGADGEHLWANYPNYTVFRHCANRKWFALLMDVPREKLGLPGGGSLDILNVKCDPIAIGSFRAEPGIYPGYHMNKSAWISVALDGSVEEEKVKLLLDMSFTLTAPKIKTRGK